MITTKTAPEVTVTLKTKINKSFIIDINVILGTNKAETCATLQLLLLFIYWNCNIFCSMELFLLIDKQQTNIISFETLCCIFYKK